MARSRNAFPWCYSPRACSMEGEEGRSCCDSLVLTFPLLDRDYQSMGRVLFLVLISGATPAMADQPVAYSHKQHMALGLQCLDCHISADISAAAGIPSVRKCMLCH